MRASGLLGRASKLVRSERYEDAREVLRRALDLVPATPGGRTEPARFSARIMLLKVQSQVAAKLNDVPLATRSIREALPMWLESGLPQTAKFQTMIEWEAWARQYRAWAEHRDEP